MIASHQPQWLPWLPYLAKLAAVEQFVYSDDVPYRPGDWQNRNRIRCGERVRWLTVPVKAHEGQRLADVRLAGQDWRAAHRGLVQSFYAKAPHYAAERGLWEQVITSPAVTLADLVIQANTLFLAAWGPSRPPVIRRGSTLALDHTDRTRRLLSLLAACEDYDYCCGDGTLSYLDLPALRRGGAKVWRFSCGVTPYAQVGPGFVPDLSCVDVFFCLGHLAGPGLCQTSLERV